MHQPPRFALIADRRAIIDRRAVADRLAALGNEDLRQTAAPLLHEALEKGRAEIARRLAAEPGRGRVIAASYAFLAAQLVRLIHDLVVQGHCPGTASPDGERIAIIGLGGTGRGELAPHSDLDLMFLIADRGGTVCEQAVEQILYLLWDLKLKVGHSVRTPDEVIAAARDDMTARTALLESRFIWGDEALSDATRHRFRTEIVAGSEREFVAAKLAERDERHRRMGDSRYVVEPNVKDGKGEQTD